MKITRQQIREMVSEAVRNQKRKQLMSEGAVAFTAIRRLHLAAQESAMDFEKSMIQELGLMDPDQMDEADQRNFLAIVSKFKSNFVAAVVDCSKALINLPKEEEEPEEEGRGTMSQELPSAASIPSVASKIGSPGRS